MKLDDEDVKRIVEAVAERLISKETVEEVAWTVLKYLFKASLVAALFYVVIKKIFG